RRSRKPRISRSRWPARSSGRAAWNRSPSWRRGRASASHRAGRRSRSSWGRFMGLGVASLRWPALLVAPVLAVLWYGIVSDDRSQAGPDRGMRIHFERSGGVAGISLGVIIDVDALPPPEAQRVRELVDASGFFALPAVLAGPGSDADRFQYTLT